MAYKFNIGDIVVLRPRVSPTASGGVFEIVKKLPGEGEPEYHIKSANEPHQRTARESEIYRAEATPHAPHLPRKSSQRSR
jgi:hypothetical protein